MTVLSRREFLARADVSLPAATAERLVFVGHSVVADETETFVLRLSCSNYFADLKRMPNERHHVRFTIIGDVASNGVIKI